MRSVLFINGNDPKALLNSTLYGADALAYDLHDAVDAANKDAARLLLQEALAFFDFGQARVFVRINPMSECGAEDIAVAGKGRPQAFILPQADAACVREADTAIAALEAENGFAAGSIKLIPVAESALAIANTAELLASCPRIIAAVFNARGFLKDMGAPDAGASEQVLYARSRLAVACRVAGIPAIDGAFLQAKDADGLTADAARARSLGFSGKVAVSGNQVPVINEIFA
ncbi:aldolase/citrate lyase family protein [Desulfovibrio sp. ZJ200]|uniref:HpcH/HpaI aldolase/citrate lyase family protein n=1 Tax=Desulfovibrio sp. ZJ200 TaxID=2709792 RepID=UPI0013EC9B20|nr:aldolase/citrate lyase family protein [Desulfovibrio sp. ZJ200]